MGPYGIFVNNISLLEALTLQQHGTGEYWGLIVLQ
jgi:hypothetical protein